MTRLLIALTMAFGLAFPAWADEEDAAEAGVHEAGAKFDYGFSGMLARDNRTQLAPLTLASGKPVASAEYKLKSGGYYRIDINADGSQELALSGGDFFRAVWVDEVIINDEMHDIGTVLEELKKQLAVNPERVITIKADASLEANKLVDLMQMVRDAGGINLSLITESSSL